MPEPDRPRCTIPLYGSQQSPFTGTMDGKILPAPACTIPGIGPVVALTYRATVDVPARFKQLQGGRRGVGLTPSKYQSGESDRTGGISKCGDEMMRVMLYEAAQVMLTRANKWSWLKAWAVTDRQAPRDEEGNRGLGTPAWPSSCTAYGLTAPSSAGPEKKRQHESGK